MSLSAFVPLVEPVVRLVVTLLENALRDEAPERYLRRRLEAELAHRTTQEALRAALERNGKK